MNPENLQPDITGELQELERQYWDATELLAAIVARRAALMNVLKESA